MSIQKGREVVRIEAEAIAALESRIDENSSGRPWTSCSSARGGSSSPGLASLDSSPRRSRATMTSTGTAALFLHAAEGLHGDLGAVLNDDAVICISKSGNTEEILQLMPMFKRQGVPIISITGNPRSEMALRSDVVLDVSVKEEACPFDFVPTSSTTATLVMGDALALALFQERGFSMEEFAQFHPGGSIGKKLLLRVDDVMRTGDDIGKVRLETPMPETILEITSKRIGATCVMDGPGQAGRHHHRRRPAPVHGAARPHLAAQGQGHHVQEPQVRDLRGLGGSGAARHGAARHQPAHRG